MAHKTSSILVWSLEIIIKDGWIYFSISVPADRAEALEPRCQAAEAVGNELDDVASVNAVLTAEASGGESRKITPPAPPSAAMAKGERGSSQVAALPGIKHLVAVASRKGGVGKSTTTVNLEHFPTEVDAGSASMRSIAAR